MTADGSRFCCNVLMLVTPTLAVVALGVYFMFSEVPGIVRTERRRVNDLYRPIAAEIKAGKAGEIVTNLPGRVEFSGQMKPGRWGWRSVSRGTSAVWYEENKTVLCREVPAFPETDFAFIFWAFGPTVLFILSAMTVHGVYRYHEHLKARSDFMKATAHDLITPIAGMKLAIGRDDATARLLCDRLSRLVDNVRDFIRFDGTVTIAQDVFDLREAYTEAYALYAEDYRDLFDGADVEVEDDGGIYAVSGDETRTVQVLWNLLGNDLKYAAPYGKVRVKFTREKEFVGMDFIDEGPGMSEYALRHAFDRYYRERTVLESGKGGFGIGLCTAREFVRLMGGRLTVKKNDPHGCVFTLRLPAAGKEGEISNGR